MTAQSNSLESSFVDLRPQGNCSLRDLGGALVLESECFGHFGMRDVKFETADGAFVKSISSAFSSACRARFPSAFRVSQTLSAHRAHALIVQCSADGWRRSA